MTDIDKFVETYAKQLSDAIQKMLNEVKNLIDIGDSFIKNHKLSDHEIISVKFMQSDIFKYHIWEILLHVPDFARKTLIDQIMQGISNEEKTTNRSVH